ncbi:transposase [Rhodococcus pyridinivorans]|nr:transposase [Rhodococcus pyridinivorans]MCD5422452.1 transposase [Rhodococcus pyridinivorans]
MAGGKEEIVRKLRRGDELAAAGETSEKGAAELGVSGATLFDWARPVWRYHKSTHTATAVDPVTNADLCSIRIDATLTDYKKLIAWAKAWPTHKWAIENAEGLGHHLAQWLLTLGEVVLDVPTTATARVRELSRGGRRKNDRIDAAAAACVAALQGDALPGRPRGHDRYPGVTRRATNKRV